MGHFEAWLQDIANKFMCLPTFDKLILQSPSAKLVGMEYVVDTCAVKFISNPDGIDDAYHIGLFLGNISSRKNKNKTTKASVRIGPLSALQLQDASKSPQETHHQFCLQL